MTRRQRETLHTYNTSSKKQRAVSKTNTFKFLHPHDKFTISTPDLLIIPTHRPNYAIQTTMCEMNSSLSTAIINPVVWHRTSGHFVPLSGQIYRSIDSQQQRDHIYRSRGYLVSSYPGLLTQRRAVGPGQEIKLTGLGGGILGSAWNGPFINPSR